MGLKFEAILIGIIVICLAISGMMYYRMKAIKAENAALQQQVEVQAATIAQHAQNTAAIHGSANTQQVIAQNAAPIHQAIDDSTPETLLNDKQKTIADCIVALFRGVLKGGSCGGAERVVLPATTQTGPDRAKDR